jgi:hypothetical protein
MGFCKMGTALAVLYAAAKRARIAHNALSFQINLPSPHQAVGRFPVISHLCFQAILN